VYFHFLTALVTNYYTGNKVACQEKKKKSTKYTIIFYNVKSDGAKTILCCNRNGKKCVKPGRISDKSIVEMYKK